MRPPFRLPALVAALAALALPSPASAVVGGSDAQPGEFPSVARITFGPFQCTGTLIAPDTVLSAGHCSSLTGAAVATPASWPAPLITVRIGGDTRNTGEVVPVSRVIMHPSYVLRGDYDVSLLRLSRASTKAPTKVVGAAERSLWQPGVMQTVVGWGVTEEGGDVPDRLQKAEVPITTDDYCDTAYASWGGINRQTEVCAGYPQGGVDACQGDSGGPLLRPNELGERRVTAVVSWGDGCARAGRPGVYARVGDTTLREWVRGHVPQGVAG
jgi:trypsin